MRHVSKGAAHPTLSARFASHQVQLAAGTTSKSAWSNFGYRAETRAVCLAVLTQ
jgi:hypothetical protein